MCVCGADSGPGCRRAPRRPQSPLRGVGQLEGLSPLKSPGFGALLDDLVGARGPGSAPARAHHRLLRLSFCDDGFRLEPSLLLLCQCVCWV
jgi:hypothetical protein